MAKLTIKDEQGRERVHELVDDSTTVGRASANVIQITDEKASRNHFKIEKAGDFFKVIDLGSTNGVRLNGTKIQGDATLRAGDQLSLGKTTFTYDGPGPESDSRATKQQEARAPKVATASVGMPASPTAVTRGDSLELELRRSPGGAAVTEELPAAVPGQPPPEPEPPGPKYVLRVIEGRNPGQMYEFNSKPMTLGRHINNTIQIIDDAASNYHAEIVREPIGYVLSDLSSTNGTKARQKNKTEFEKIVKTPLAIGMQIRIGKTVLEFQNVGKPVPDEALFGTIALDPDKVDAKLPDATPAAPRGVPKGVLAVAVVALFIGIVVAAVKLLPDEKPPEIVEKPPPVVPPVEVKNLIANGDFEKGPDDLGVPFDFRVEKPPGVRIAVLSDAQRAGGDGKSALGLQISKTNAKSPSALAVVEVADSFPVDPNAVYEFKGAMRNDGDGLFGLRVTWLQGERALSEHPVVLKDSQDWKEKTVLLTPPSWAERARAGVFSQGKEGKASFDELSFMLKPGAEASPRPSVAFGGISVDFQGSKGAFYVSAQKENIVEDGTLMLVSPDGNAACELTSAIEPEVTAEAARASYKGRIYDFALQELTDFRINAQHGAAGVDLRAAVDALPDGSRPQLRFYVIGAPAQGDIEIAKPGGNEFERVQPTEEKAFTGIQGLLFNAGKAPQLDVSFGAPVDVELKREGVRRRVIVRFKNELNFSLAPESVGQKQKMMALVNSLQKSLQEKNWGEVEQKTKQLSETYGGRFPQAQEEASKAKDLYDAVWSTAQNDIKKAIDSYRTSKTTAAAENAHKVVDRHLAAWSTSSKADELKELHTTIDDIKKASQSENAEADAEANYQKALAQFNNKVYPVAKSYLETKILNDPVNSKTKAAEKAKELLAKVIAGQQRQDDLERIERNLIERTKNYIQLKDYKKAIDLIEADADYQANKDDLTEIQSRLQTWKKKRGDRD